MVALRSKAIPVRGPSVGAGRPTGHLARRARMPGRSPVPLQRGKRHGGVVTETVKLRDFVASVGRIRAGELAPGPGEAKVKEDPLGRP
jgi:hypothetical protein